MSVGTTLQEIEEQAFHAYREWPVWLILREKELDAHLHQQNGGSPQAET